MNVIETGIPGVLIFEPRVHGDERGFFMESWNAARYHAHGLPAKFVQSNISRSAEGVVRGLHYQQPQPQGKLISVLQGRVFDVAVDIRSDSPTFRQWVGVELSAENHRQLYVPEGFAHGFCAMGGSALFSYLCSSEYRAEYDRAIAWDDPDLAIRWPVENPTLSDKDAAAPLLSNVPEDDLPRMSSC